MALMLLASRKVVVVQEIVAVSIGPRKLDNSSFTRFFGTVGYTLSFDTVNIRVEAIRHNKGSTGTLKLALWAVANYDGTGNWRGTRVGERRLEPCFANECYRNINHTVTRNSPNPGYYTMILSLEAFIGGKFVMVDHRVFDKRINITKDAKMLGTVGYSVGSGQVQLRVEKIAHNFNGDTGTMKLILWASSTGIVNGNWTGYKLAKVKLDPLKRGYSRTGITRTVGRRTVPSGCYYIIMQLLSYTANGWVAHDSRQFSEYATL